MLTSSELIYLLLFFLASGYLAMLEAIKYRHVTTIFVGKYPTRHSRNFEEQTAAQ